MSPQWALSSYSCIFGKPEITNNKHFSHNWQLQTITWNGDNEAVQTQSVNVARIHKYPQVSHDLFGSNNLFSCSQRLEEKIFMDFCLFQTKFKHFLYSGDVALLELADVIDFDKGTAAACLTDEPIDKNSDECVTIGWLDNKGEQDFPASYRICL